MNNFDDYKVFYASFYAPRYYQKDFLLFDYEKSPSSGGPNKTKYVYTGFCNSDKIKGRIELSAVTVETKDFYSNRVSHKIPIWKISIAKKKILFRNKNDTIHSPFSYQMRDYWIGAISSILFIPSLIYYLYLRNKDNKNKIK